MLHRIISVSRRCGLFCQFNERFEYKCQNCICEETSKTITCQPKVCPPSPVVNCTIPGSVLVNQTNPADTCCSVLSCRKMRSQFSSIYSHQDTGGLRYLLLSFHHIHRMSKQYVSTHRHGVSNWIYCSCQCARGEMLSRTHMW